MQIGKRCHQIPVALYLQPAQGLLGSASVSLVQLGKTQVLEVEFHEFMRMPLVNPVSTGVGRAGIVSVAKNFFVSA